MNDTTRAAIRMALTYIEHHSGVIDDEEDCPHPLAIREALCAALVSMRAAQPQRAEPDVSSVCGMPFSEARKVILDMGADDARGTAISLLIQLSISNKLLAETPAQPQQAELAALRAAALPTLPFAVFDEFGKGADDRVQDYARNAVRAALDAALGKP